MKRPTRLSGFAAAVLCLLAGAASAGTLTIERGPSFLPGSAFTDNDIAATLLHDPPGVMGDVVRLFGDSMVAPTAAEPRIIIGGNFSANAGDLFSVIYDFTVDLNSATPVTLTLAAQTVVAGVHESFSTLVTLNPGLQHYQGQIDGRLFGLATGGASQRRHRRVLSGSGASATRRNEFDG